MGGIGTSVSMTSCFEAEVVRAIAHLTSADAVIREVIAAIGPCGLSPAWHCEPFESLVRAVSHQQLQGNAAEAILARFLALFAPEPFPTPLAVLAADEETLRSVGLSGSKILAFRDIAAKAEAGVIPTRLAAEALTDAELIRRLVPIRGVGRWTVEMLLIFALGRLDVFPTDDFGVRKGLKIAYGLPELPTKREMLSIAEPWRPYRSVATWYLWRLVQRAGRDQRSPRRGTAAPKAASAKHEMRGRRAGGRS